ncbi:MAG: histidine phosphatase family protein [Chloroflexota bacterium]|nr:histidine phosphatase family protein [Chloroflexota bacterium]
MTIFFLIRHGSHSLLSNTVAGRMPGIHLSETGLAQARSLAARLAHIRLDALYSSPMERAIETAQPLAAQLGLTIYTDVAFNELEFGAWTGRKFTDLINEPTWHNFNLFRSGTRPPGGELMLEAQARVVSRLEQLRSEHPAGTVAVVCHSDIIKAMLLHFLGMPLDLFSRIEISPASVSILKLEEYGAQVLSLNDTGNLSELLQQ